MSNMDSSNRASSAAVISLEEVAALKDERGELSVLEIPAIEESSDLRWEFTTSFNSNNFSWLYELPPQENTDPKILSQEILDPSLALKP
ncbi:hypothetical protein OUZ56_003505 [Daphnia magna]|uniref:Uncharacterized protein n=1 Tax=Daphnia magna TaxID=35525 RepID=A0ABR0A986_9CRUS|nr:hypothetical protein OUZ56_003505 [Daphnia magna]